MKYPYLAKKVYTTDSKETKKENSYVVMFTEEEKGVVLVNDTDNENIYVGKIGTFDEETFEILPPNVCVRLNN